MAERKINGKTEGRENGNAGNTERGRGRAGIFLLAGGICMASVVILLGGMSLYARKKGNHTDYTDAAEQGTEETTDIINSVLAESSDTEAADGSADAGNQNGGNIPSGSPDSADDPDSPYACVPILTWDEYYALGPSGNNNPNISGEGIYGTWSENELTMEEAGTLGLREIYRVFGDEVDFSQMYLTMVLQDAENRKWSQTDTWYGYMMNFVNGDTPEPGWYMCSYSFEMNAVTGEIYLLENRVNEEKAKEEKESGQTELLQTEELEDYAKRYLEQLGLADPSELTVEIVRMDGESPEGSGVTFSRDGEPYLEIVIWPYSGRLRGYRYCSKV